ncbi:MAG: glycosyltransferase [Rhodothermales bacterium]
MLVFSATLVAFGIAYAYVLVRFTGGFRRLIIHWLPHRHEPYPSVSVIVPARNEAEGIADCIQSILRNDYPRELVDVQIVDDRSEDDTFEIASRLSLGPDDIRVVRLQETGSSPSGKRAAIQAGIDRSKGDIIMLTDADCRVPTDWIHTMVSAFNEGTRFVSGPVAYRTDKGWLQRLLELELLGLVAVGAGAIALGKPNMCNGANIAFRRSAFNEADGYSGTDSLTSGDDELLMQKMSRQHPGSVAFCPDREATVTTRAPNGLPELLRQRRRWASKGLHYPEKRITVLALFVFSFNVLLLAGFVGAFWFVSIWPALLAAFFLKLSAEGWMFWHVCSQFGRRELIPLMVPGQLFVIPFVVVAGATGAAGGYSWKGREIQR